MTKIKYLRMTTSIIELETEAGGNGKAISSAQVMYKAYTAGLGNSLNLQSMFGNFTFPFIAFFFLKKSQGK